MCVGYPVINSRPDFSPLKKETGQMKTSDFSATVFENVPVPHSHNILPLYFCALEAGWVL